MTNNTETLREINQQFTQSLKDIPKLLEEYVTQEEDKQNIERYIGNLYLLLDTLVQHTSFNEGGKHRGMSFRQWLLQHLPSDLPEPIKEIVNSLYDHVWQNLTKAVCRLLDEVHLRQIPTDYSITYEYILLEFFHRHPGRQDLLTQLDPNLAQWIRNNL